MKRYLKVLFVSVIFAGCKSVALLPTNTPVKNVDIQALASKIRSNYPKVNNVRSRIKATYNNGEREQQLVIQLRMEEKKRVWLSATMLIPIAKLMITPQEVSFYEKFQKTFFQGNFDFINASFNTDFDYSDIENLFLGKPFIDPSIGKWKQISNPEYYILIPQGKRPGLTPTLFFDPTTFLLKEQRFILPKQSYNLTLKYLRHIKVEGVWLPSLIQLTLFDGKVSQQLELEFSRIDFTEGLTFPFEIPQGYSKIEF